MVEGVLPSGVSGQAVADDAVYVGLGPDLLRLHPATGVQALEFRGGPPLVVHDVRVGASGAEVLAVSPAEVRVIVWPGGASLSSFDATDVRAAAFAFDGLVIVRTMLGRCVAVFTVTGAEVPLEGECAGPVQLAVGPDAVYAALGPMGLFEARPSGARRIAEAANGVSYDGAADQLVVPLGWQQGLVGLSRGGELLWERDVSVQRAIALPGFGIAWTEQAGVGAALVLADAGGVEIERLVLDAPVRELAASPDGAQLGVARDNDHATYAILP